MTRLLLLAFCVAAPWSVGGDAGTTSKDLEELRCQSRRPETGCVGGTWHCYVAALPDGTPYTAWRCFVPPA